MFNLPLAAVDVALTGLQLGSLGHPFEIPHVAPDRYTDVLLDLERNRFAYEGKLEREVEEVLVTVARSAVQIDLFGYLETDSGERVLRARGANNGRSAVLAVQEGEVVRFIETDDIASAVVDLLPPGRAGTQRPARFPAGAPDDPQHAVSVSNIRQVLTQRRSSAGCVASRYRDPRGTERPGTSLTWLDAESGRYAMQEASTPDGQRWVAMVPADQAAIESWVRERMEEK